MKKFRSLFTHRFGPVAVVVVLVTGISFLTRLFLFIRSWHNLELTVLNVPAIFIIGFFYDLVVAGFFSVAVALYCWLMKDAWYQKKWNRLPLYLLLLTITLILLINAGAEIAFWDEFNVRFNFIAVDSQILPSTSFV